jgi:predicted phage terminase large subunit-like protein
LAFRFLASFGASPARVNSHADFHHGGRPQDHPIAPWVEGFVEECSTFPNGKYDDQVDQMSQALNRLRAMVSLPKPYLPMPRPPTGDRGWMA